MLGEDKKKILEDFNRCKKQNWSFGIAGKPIEVSELTPGVYQVVTKGWPGIYAVYRFDHDKKLAYKLKNSIGKPKFTNDKGESIVKRLFSSIRSFFIKSVINVNTQKDVDHAKVSKESAEQISNSLDEYFDALDELTQKSGHSDSKESISAGIQEDKSHVEINNEEDEYFDALEELMQDDQYYDCQSYKLKENSKIFEDNKTIALALYNQPHQDKIKIENKPKPERKSGTTFKLVGFKLREGGYTAKLENDRQIVTIDGKNAYIVLPDFMDSQIVRKEDKRKNISSGISGYYDDNPAVNSEVRFNVMVMLDAEINIDNLFKVEGNRFNPVTQGKRKILNTAKERGVSAGFRVSSEQKDYVKFIIDTSAFQINVTKQKAINYYSIKEYHPSWINSLIKNIPGFKSLISTVYNTVVEMLSKSCKEKIEVDKTIGDLKLKLIQKDVLMNGRILNQAIDKALLIKHSSVSNTFIEDAIVSSKQDTLSKTDIGLV